MLIISVRALAEGVPKNSYGHLSSLRVFPVVSILSLSLFLVCSTIAVVFLLKVLSLSLSLLTIRGSESVVFVASALHNPADHASVHPIHLVSLALLLQYDIFCFLSLCLFLCHASGLLVSLVGRGSHPETCIDV